MTMTKFRTFAALFLMSLAVLTAAAQKPQEPPPDYFPLRVADWWKFRSTTADGKQSEFTIKVLCADKQADGTTLYQVETLTSFQPIHDWYSKPRGEVLMHRIAY